MVVGLSSGACERFCANLDPRDGEGAYLVHRAIANDSPPAEMAEILNRLCADGARGVIALYLPPWAYLQQQISAEGREALDADVFRYATRVLARWQSYHLALLGFTRRNPSTVFLLNGSRPIDLGVLSDRLQEKLGDPAPVTAALLGKFEPIKCLYEQALMQIVEGLATECVDLYAELESCAELTGREPEFEFDGLAQRQAARIDVLQLCVEHQLSCRARDRNQKLARDLEQQLSVLQQDYQAAVQLADQRFLEKESATKSLSETKIKVASLEKANSDLQGDKELLTRRLQQGTEELQRLSASSQRDAEQLNRLQSTIESSAANLSDTAAHLAQALQDKEAVSSQLSQMTARNMDLEARQTTLKSENELYLLQLHQVQEELEHYFRKYKDQTGELKQLKLEQEAQSRSVWRRLFPKKSALPSNSALALPSKKPFAAAKLIAAQKEKRSLKSQVRQIRNSGLFDEKWYLHHYPDIAEAGCDPIVHYVKFGAKEGRNPSSAFDSRWYLRNHLDVAKAEFNPLLHYIKFGINEERQTMRSSD